MTPRIPTRRPSVRSKMGVNDPLAVTITLMTPNPNTKLARVANEQRIESHFIKWSFSATFSGVRADSILDNKASISLEAESCISACANLYQQEHSVSKSLKKIVTRTYSNAFPCLMNKIRSIVIAA